MRFRILGYHPLTVAIESDADTVEKVVEEMFLARQSERQGRVIDFDSSARMKVKETRRIFLAGFA